MDAKIEQFVKDLAQAAGPNLLSVILYGSAASGEFHARHSDVNLLCLFERLDAEALARINPVTRRWALKGHAPPLVFAASQLARAADVFAIELVDIKASHQVLHGADLVAPINVPMTLHHLEVERELRQNLVRLRESYLASDGSRKAVLGLMTASVSSFAALLRHAVIALEAGGETPPPVRKRESIDCAAALLGFEARPFHTLLDLREGKTPPREVDAGALFRNYLAAISEVVSEVDRRLEERSKR
ncbi:MAG TPA: nucleotidyltransferase domain-containing protein [Terriglobia bacterium]